MSCAKIFFLSAFFFPLTTLAFTAEDSSAKAPAKRSSPIQNIFDKQSQEVEVVADQIEYLKNEDKILAKGNAILRYHETEITADYAEVKTETKKAYARGHVLIFRHGRISARGEEIHYDFESDSGQFPNGRTFHPPWFTSGENFEQVREGLQWVRNGSVSTCYLERPHYDFRAKKVTIYSHDKMIAQNVTIHVLGKPVFWWPYLIIPLNDRPQPPLQIKTGYNSEHGVILSIAKGISITRQIGGRLLGDWRSKRGFGTGAEIDYDYGEKFYGQIRGYWTQDKRAPVLTGENPYSERERRDRGRISAVHRSDMDPYSYVMLRYNRIADERFLQDFFEHEHRAEIEPQSFATLIKNSDRYGFLTHVEKKMNRYESLVERLPEVKFNWKNQPFFSDKVFAKSEVSYANLAKRFRRSDYDEDVWRIDEHNQWILPIKWREIKLTPFADLGGTYFSREKESDEDRFRTTYGGGVDLRTQTYKMQSVSFNRFGVEVNQLRHVFEPSVQVKSLRSTVSDETLNEFDALDRIDDSEIVTFGIENRLQTKRAINGKMKRVDIVSLNTFLSYEIHPDGRSQSSRFIQFDNASTSSNFTILTQDFTVRPYEWLQYEMRFDYDMDRDSFRVFNHDLVARTRKFYFLFGQRFLKSILDQKGSDQFVFVGSYRINSLWDVGGYIRWDAQDFGLEEWQVSATRDLHDFILDFGYNVRNSAIRSNNKELFFNFRFKAFPQLSLRSGPGRASFGEPRIGETVAGSTQYSGSSFFQEEPLSPFPEKNQAAVN